MPASIWSFGRVFSGVLLLGLFFLPWLELSCSRTTLLKVSGFQMATGFDVEDPSKDLKAFFGEGPKVRSKKAKAKAEPVYFLVPAVAMVLLTLGLLEATKTGRQKVGGIAALLGSLFLAYKAVKPMGTQEMPPGMEQVIRVEWLPAFWLSLALMVAWTIVEGWPEKGKAEAPGGPPQPPSSPSASDA